MRLPTIPPSMLDDAQKPLYDDMKKGIADHFQGFVNVRDDGALLGPWNPWLHEPQFGKPVWELTKAMASQPSLPAVVREVAILVTGSHFKSAYELYAHVVVAENRGLSDEKLSTIVAGQRPADLTRPEAVAYDFASALVNGGVLPELTYRSAVEQFGKHGAAELSYLVGLYCLVSVTLIRSMSRYPNETPKRSNRVGLELFGAALRTVPISQGTPEDGQVTHSASPPQ